MVLDYHLQEAREKEMAKLKQTIAEKDNTIAEKDALLQKYIEQFGELK